MDATTIKNCTDIELLEEWESKVYRNCVDINNCDKCFHKNEDDLCDLELLTIRINELHKLELGKYMSERLKGK